MKSEEGSCRREYFYSFLGYSLIIILQQKNNNKLYRIILIFSRRRRRKRRRRKRRRRRIRRRKKKEERKSWQPAKMDGPKRARVLLAHLVCFKCAFRREFHACHARRA